MIQGPNVKKLIVEFMAKAMFPSGGGLASAVESLLKPGGIGDAARGATKAAEDAINAIKAAPDNKWGDDDEAIAGEILKRVWEKRGPSCCSKCGRTMIHFRIKGYRCLSCD